MDTINQNEFEKLLAAEQPLIVDFYADWCGPCRMLAPVLDELAEEYGTITFVKVNVDNDSALAVRYGIDSIPCIIRFDGGTESGRSIGYVTKMQLEDKLMLG